MARLESDLFNYKSKYEKDGELVTINGITEKEERVLTAKRLAELYINPGEQTFDVKHYLSIHKYLFDGIYSFAGEIRSEVICKRIPFCLPHLIYNNLKYVLEDANRKMYNINNRDDLVEFITYYYAELDIIHPFREGNGRCEREYLRQFIDYICTKRNLDSYNLDYNLIGDRNDFIDAVVMADDCNYDNLRGIIDSILVCKDKELIEKSGRRKR